MKKMIWAWMIILSSLGGCNSPDKGNEANNNKNTPESIITVTDTTKKTLVVHLRWVQHDPSGALVNTQYHNQICNDVWNLPDNTVILVEWANFPPSKMADIVHGKLPECYYSNPNVLIEGIETRTSQEIHDNFLKWVFKNVEVSINGKWIKVENMGGNYTIPPDYFKTIPLRIVWNKNDIMPTAQAFVDWIYSFDENLKMKVDERKAKWYNVEVVCWWTHVASLEQKEPTYEDSYYVDQWTLLFSNLLDRISWEIVGDFIK